MKLFLAPMVGRTDKYFRKLIRLMSPNITLFTEMITVDSLLRGNFRNYAIPSNQHPIVAQVAGNDKNKFMQASDILAKMGFDEINLNIGCPSSKVVKGGFGACQIDNPDDVASYVRSILSCTNLPVSIKTRLGLGYEQNLESIEKFIHITSDAGCEIFYIHARNAVLNGLSTKKNRSVPPLRYDDVLKLKNKFPHLKIYINGGIDNLDEATHLLNIYGGIMIGRKIYDDPRFLLELEKKIFSFDNNLSTPSIVKKYINQLDFEERNNKLYALKHLTNLYKGTSLSKKWRKYLHTLINSDKPITDVNYFNNEVNHGEKKINCSHS